MQKEVENVISPLLYEIIDEYRKTLPLEAVYLFPSPIDVTRPRNSGGIVENLQKEIDALNIKNPDGTAYHLTPHSYRHLMASRMLNASIPYQFIQEQLHHKSPEMTFVYVEYSDDRKARLTKEFINSQGRDAIYEVDVQLTESELDAELVRKAINAQMLPNGICAYPIKLGKCPHANRCLECASFRTSVDDLPVHKQQMERTQRYMQLCIENGWEQQIESCKHTIKTLKGIIGRLEQSKH